VPTFLAKNAKFSSVVCFTAANRRRADLSRHKSARARAEAEKLRSKEEAETEAVQVGAETMST
jgi:hypothetical protein